MASFTKKLIIGILALVVLVLAASFIYAKVINKADDEFDSSDVRDRLTPTTLASATTTTGHNVAASTDGVDGSWVISAGSEVGYRVDESINGFDTTANGRTTAVTGRVHHRGHAGDRGEFTRRHDHLLQRREQTRRTRSTAASWRSRPVPDGDVRAHRSRSSFDEVPADGTTITATATGDLTLHGVTKSVTFLVEATFQVGRVGVFGQIPIVFADYDIDNPSIASIRTEDNGLLEFVLIFDRA